ncbi:MAG: hypothetical protein ABIP61_03415 [Burkholderiaceae bacterium]
MERNESENGIRSACRRHPVWTGAVVVAALALTSVMQSRGLKATSATTSRPAASFAIASPTAGTTVSSPVQLRVAVTGAKIGRPSAGLDHLHVEVDDGDVQAIYDRSELTVPLPRGQHTIIVDLAGPDHQSLTPPQLVTFFVR